MTEDINLQDAVIAFLMTYTGLPAHAPIFANFVGTVPIQYSVIPMPGARILEEYVTGASHRQYTFAIQSMNSTADEEARLAATAFFEDLSDWLESQTNAGVFPTLNSNQTPTYIEAINIGYMYQQGQSETGVYQVNCRLEYDQDAP